MRRTAIVLALVAVLVGTPFTHAQQSKSDSDRIAELEARVASLESASLPLPAQASEVWNGSFFAYDPDHTFYLYCTITPFGMTLANQQELKCMGVVDDRSIGD